MFLIFTVLVLIKYNAAPPTQAGGPGPTPGEEPAFEAWANIFMEFSKPNTRSHRSQGNCPVMLKEKKLAVGHSITSCLLKRK